MADGSADERMDLPQFLHRLAVDPDALAAYLDDPDAAIDRAGLDDEERESLRAGRDAVMDVIGRIRAVEESAGGREPAEGERRYVLRFEVPLIFPHMTKPPTEPAHITKPPTEPEHVTKPPTEPEHVTKPPTEPEHVTKPPSEPGGPS